MPKTFRKHFSVFFKAVYPSAHYAHLAHYAHKAHLAHFAHLAHKAHLTHSHRPTFAHSHILTPCLAFLTPCLAFLTPCLGVTTSWHQISTLRTPRRNTPKKNFRKNNPKSLELNKLFVPLHRYPCEKGKQQRAEPKATSLKAQSTSYQAPKPQDFKTTFRC